MSVNGITENTKTYTNDIVSNSETQKKQDASALKDSEKDKGVVYEPSKATDSNSNKITDYTSIVKTMKKELSTKNEHLQKLVDQMLGKQASKYTSLSEMYKNIKADPETVAQAQKDVSEDGYWGVKQTSDRLVSMAKALSGGDTTKADEMIDAIKKGYDQAAKSWGDKLPDISQQTVDAAVTKLQNWRDGLPEV